MKIGVILSCLIAVMLSASILSWHAMIGKRLFLEEVMMVRRLHGESVPVKISELCKLKPLSWALTLDLTSGKEQDRCFELFAEQCKKQPDLEEKVLEIIRVKSRFDSIFRRSLSSLLQEQ